jgi:hypothetical protein
LDILSILPELLGICLIIVTAAMVLWMAIRKLAPAAEGRNLGIHNVIGLDGDNNIRLNLNGALIETPRFLNANNKSAVKTFLTWVVAQKLSDLNKDPQKNAQAIKDCKAQEAGLKELGADDLAKMARVVVLRDGFQKHVLLQWHHVAKSLDKYACIETHSKLTLSFGFVVQGKIVGWVKTERTYEGKLPGFGRFKLHFFDPMFVGDEKPVDPPSWLGQLMLYVPTYVELQDELKSKENQIVNLVRQKTEMGLDLSAAKAEADFYKGALQDFGVEDINELKGKMTKLSLLDFVLVGGPTVLFALIAMSLDFNSIYGMFLGLFAGAGLVAISARFRMPRFKRRK